MHLLTECRSKKLSIGQNSKMSNNIAFAPSGRYQCYQCMRSIKAKQNNEKKQNIFGLTSEEEEIWKISNIIF